jgi:diacylglycerol kinase (ATP)
MNRQSFSISGRIRSFGFALNGLRILFREEHNARVHLLGAALALLAGWFFQLSSMEWMALLVCIALVFMLEIINSVLERLADVVSPGIHPLIGQAKDLSAAAVLVAALLSVAVGSILFIPKIIQHIHYVIH